MVSLKVIQPLLLLSILTVAEDLARTCKAVPGTASWPSTSDWDALNKTLSGNLIKPLPPGGVCHPEQPNYDEAACPAVQRAWTTSWSFHIEDPVGNGYNNWNNDTCLPAPENPCSADGYPSYVINANTAQHVQAGINFARERNIRLVVKGTGHDFRGRTVAPDSLSIWTRHLRGIQVRETFEIETDRQPCKQCSYGPVVTFASGEDHSSVFAEVNKHGFMLNVGAAGSVGEGGYTTGGGHSVLSFQTGLAVDNVIQARIVTPDGKIVTANRCKNSELFWALCGGGGSTLGVVLDFTVNIFPSVPIAYYTFNFVSTGTDIAHFWDAVAYVVGKYADISKGGAMGYTSVAPALGTSPPGYQGSFTAPNMTISELSALIDPIVETVDALYPGEIQTVVDTSSWGSLYEWWTANPDITTATGINVVIGSRILDESALKHPQLASLIQKATPPRGLRLYLVAGPGTHQYANDWNSVTPAWRTGYVHAVVSGPFLPLNAASKAAAINNVTTTWMDPLRELAPNTGAYQNEANAFDPNFQQEFWGSNYPRLLKAKRQFDPNDVFWCRSCAGSERWEEVGTQLCKV
ncbi:FAD-binding domain-containing protein [Eremomyces bilateralis CBS 781.70]|uniref:FAD-binding domain-containing protein n=1 Tax=Eremomyces bilateralis CBS 781.70 TaxID=1392243 RepID=A0A6G1FST0_9PEZI|nr:FAD-binding domain-containing protein [Eremomyces bilateralis CBS 781.70]KAF1808813.1 FAD-binding domain-containing protein [Eremomyces bilateralis CBS 781.70]